MSARSRSSGRNLGDTPVELRVTSTGVPAVGGAFRLDVPAPAR
jgi:hypothetical protein